MDFNPHHPSAIYEDKFLDFGTEFSSDNEATLNEHFQGIGTAISKAIGSLKTSAEKAHQTVEALGQLVDVADKEKKRSSQDVVEGLSGSPGSKSKSHRISIEPGSAVIVAGLAPIDHFPQKKDGSVESPKSSNVDEKNPVLLKQNTKGESKRGESSKQEAETQIKSSVEAEKKSEKAESEKTDKANSNSNSGVNIDDNFKSMEYEEEERRQKKEEAMEEIEHAEAAAEKALAAVAGSDLQKKLNEESRANLGKEEKKIGSISSSSITHVVAQNLVEKDKNSDSSLVEKEKDSKTESKEDVK